MVEKRHCYVSGSESDMDPDSIGFRIRIRIQKTPNTPPPPSYTQKREINDKFFFVKSFWGGWRLLQELGNPS
jgi:hypothetical protein